MKNNQKGVRQIYVNNLRRSTLLPEVLPTVTQQAASKGNNIVGTVDSPVHA